MEDSSLFLQWAVSTLQHQHPVAAGVVVDDDESRTGAAAFSSSGTNLPLMSWDFSAASVGVQVQPNGGGMPGARSYGGGVPEMLEHVIAERKRREKITKRFIELSAVIPKLKKMDKATILSDAASYIKKLQEKLKALEAVASGSNGGARVTAETVGAMVPEEEDIISPSSARKNLPPPEIEAWCSQNNNVMVRIHCENGKGVMVRILAEVEELHLTIINASVMPFPDGTMIIITITAK
ncbi:hypothetical protein E2562_001242, partial [Oryza meyeriana var. granulata]